MPFTISFFNQLSVTFNKKKCNSRKTEILEQNILAKMIITFSKKNKNLIKNIELAVLQVSNMGFDVWTRTLFVTIHKYFQKL